MKDWKLPVFITQLGLAVVFPLAGCVLTALWLQSRFGWGAWVFWAGLVLGMICAIEGFRGTLRTLDRLSGDKKKDEPPLSYNDHD